MSGPPPFARSGEPAPPGRQMLSVVIPILNEEKGLDSLIARLVPVLERCGFAWETIFVDDGSTDGTLARLRAIHDEEPRIKAVSLSRNFGTCR